MLIIYEGTVMLVLGRVFTLSSSNYDTIKLMNCWILLRKGDIPPHALCDTALDSSTASQSIKENIRSVRCAEHNTPDQGYSARALVQRDHACTNTRRLQYAGS